MLKKVILVSIFISSMVFAKEVEKSFRVVSLKKDKEIYKIQFNESSPIYSSSKEHLKCLVSSLEQKKNVKVVFDVRKFEIKKCHAPENK